MPPKSSDCTVKNTLSQHETTYILKETLQRYLRQRFGSEKQYGEVVSRIASVTRLGADTSSLLR